MSPKHYNKLVRDRIPEIIANEGHEYHIEVMSEDAYRQALRKKLVEEAQEVADSRGHDELIKELADLREVIDALIVAYELDNIVIEAKQEERRLERGGFKGRIKLLWVDEI